MILLTHRYIHARETEHTYGEYNGTELEKIMCVHVRAYKI